MNLFADEHVARLVFSALQKDDHDVVAIADVSDADNLVRCISERLGLLTFDSDYGDLIFHGGHAAPEMIVYIRMSPRDMATVAERLVVVLRLFPAKGRMLVVERERVRMRNFPPARNTQS